ncbi:MAG: glycosyltransferase [Patescibacteria group bacterium]|nr:glycosyltransferase [Patescibacteria group bacterium]
MKKIKIIFSIIILVYNEEKFILRLFNRLINYSKGYPTEIIFVDSQSTDNSLSILEKIEKKYSNIRVYKIKKSNFHFAKTRNWAMKKARGRYVIFISADALPATKRMFQYLTEDFNFDRRVVAIFSPLIPYADTPFIQKLEIECYWERILKFTRGSFLVQDIKQPFVKLTNNNKFIWYLLSNTFTAYKRSFLIKYPFKSGKEGCEDIYMGKLIIKKGYIKIFDRRIKIIHSHKHSLIDYIKSEFSHLKIPIFNLRFKNSFGLYCKLRKILEQKVNFLVKTRHLISLLFYYSLKGIAFFLFLISKMKSNFSYENIIRRSSSRL